MLSTGAMNLRGRTFGKLMVSLRATNTKRCHRTTSMVQASTGLDEAAAASLPHASGGDADRNRGRAHRDQRAGGVDTAPRSGESVRGALGEAAPAPAALFGEVDQGRQERVVTTGPARKSIMRLCSRSREARLR